MYRLSLDIAVANTIESELPLTSDNVYSEIQKDLIRPVYVSSEMANDAFLRDWVLAGEQDVTKVAKYLSEIRQKHGLVSCFFVSDRSRRYYFPRGILKRLSPDSPADEWFFRVGQMINDFEINIDPDAANGDELTVFVNYRVFDFNGRFIGAAGLGLPLSHVLGAVERYGSRFQRRIMLVDRSGRIVVQSSDASVIRGNIYTEPGISGIADEIIATNATSPKSLDYRREDKQVTTRVNARLIPELGWYLVVEKDDDPRPAGVLKVLEVGGALATLLLVILAIFHAYANKAHTRLIAHKEEMLAAASHDARHFVHTLYILLEATAHQCKHRKTQPTCTQMEKVVAGLDELISRFLSYYRLDAGTDNPKLQTVSLIDILQELIEEAQPQVEKIGANLVFQNNGTIQIAWSDPVLLKVILRNFLSNAIKHVEGGAIFIGLKRTGGVTRKIRIHVTNPKTCIEIGKLNKLFSLFSRGDDENDKEGIGLGLYLVSHYAKKLKCEIGAESSPEIGTTFWIDVPMASKERAKQKISEIASQRALLMRAEVPLQGYRMILIDSNQGNHYLLLKKWGASVSRTDLESFSQSELSREAIDLVLLVEEDGNLENTKHTIAIIRNQIPDSIPIVVCLPAGSLSIPNEESTYTNTFFATSSPATLRVMLMNIFTPSPT